MGDTPRLADRGETMSTAVAMPGACAGGVSTALDWRAKGNCDKCSRGTEGFLLTLWMGDDGTDRLWQADGLLTSRKGVADCARMGDTLRATKRAAAGLKLGEGDSTTVGAGAARGTKGARTARPAALDRGTRGIGTGTLLPADQTSGPAEVAAARPPWKGNGGGNVAGMESWSPGGGVSMRGPGEAAASCCWEPRCCWA